MSPFPGIKNRRALTKANLGAGFPAPRHRLYTQWRDSSVLSEESSSAMSSLSSNQLDSRKGENQHPQANQNRSQLKFLGRSKSHLQYGNVKKLLRRKLTGFKGKKKGEVQEDINLDEYMKIKHESDQENRSLDADGEC